MEGNGENHDQDPMRDNPHFWEVLLDLVGRVPGMTPARAVTVAIGLGWMYQAGILRWHQIVELLVP